MISLACLALVPLAALGAARELGVKETLALAEKYSPALDARRFDELAAEAELTGSYSTFLPRVEGEAIYSKGMQGSSSAVEVTGLMGSTYRKGPAGGIFVKDTLWDFGRSTANVRVASRKLEAEKADERVTKLGVDRVALKLLYACARNRSLNELWRRLDDEAHHVAREVQRFVGTGQRSIVEKYLSEAQYQEAATSAADYGVRYEASRDRLAAVTGLNAGELACPTIDALAAETEKLGGAAGEESPLVKSAALRIGVAEARVDRAKADYLPYLVAIGSVGVMQATELNVAKRDWSVALGLHVPLFEGFKTSSDVKREAALRDARERELDETRLELREANLRLDETIRSARVRIEHLGHELALANSAFDTARARYASFKGGVVDVRESIRNLARAETAMADARTQYLDALADKTLLNGGAL